MEAYCIRALCFSIKINMETHAKKYQRQNVYSFVSSTQGTLRANMLLAFILHISYTANLTLYLYLCCSKYSVPQCNENCFNYSSQYKYFITRVGVGLPYVSLAIIYICNEFSSLNVLLSMKMYSK